MSDAAFPRPPLAAWLPGTDRAGRFSALKFAAFLAALGPGAALVWFWSQGELAPKPITAAIHFSGDWALRMLALTLAVTPLRVVTRVNRLILIRRTLGLSALAYGLLHVALYCVEQRLDLWTVVSEIALRFYLTIGFVALAGLIALGATSNEAAVRRLGATGWNRLHALVYPIALVSLFHYFLQSKNDVTPAVLWSGYVLLLLGHRLLARRRRGASALALVGLAVAAGLATGLVEAAWYFGRSRIAPLDVLAGNLDFEIELRPPWIVFGAGLALAGLAALFNRLSPARSRGR
ncbi:MAG: ferric reductase-like transmembrane domain-containing protein [Methylobacteriaceae bacterium]|nr:ferric reductase-like transmembrane domain-containing protein [Methylobacteriaceae bacterium]